MLHSFRRAALLLFLIWTCMAPRVAQAAQFEFTDVVTGGTISGTPFPLNTCGGTFVAGNFTLIVALYPTCGFHFGNLIAGSTFDAPSFVTGGGPVTPTTFVSPVVPSGWFEPLSGYAFSIDLDPFVVPSVLLSGMLNESVRIPVSGVLSGNIFIGFSTAPFDVYNFQFRGRFHGTATLFSASPVPAPGPYSLGNPFDLAIADPVPEPGTFALLLTGGLIIARRLTGRRTH